MRPKSEIPSSTRLLCIYYNKLTQKKRYNAISMVPDISAIQHIAMGVRVHIGTHHEMDGRYRVICGTW